MHRTSGAGTGRMWQGEMNVPRSACSIVYALAPAEVIISAREPTRPDQRARSAARPAASPRRQPMPCLTLSRLFAPVILLATMSAGPLAAQPFEGCPSEQILARFEDFSRTGKMPPDLGRWLGDPKAQYIEPWKAFDNVYFVGVCWVSAWAFRTSDGVVLIDTLHEPHVEQLIANLRKVGIDPADARYVLMTHGHFDHVGGEI